MANCKIPQCHARKNGWVGIIHKLPACSQSVKAVVSGSDVECVSTKGLLTDKMLGSAINCEAQAEVCDVNNDLREAQLRGYAHLNKLIEC